MADRFFIGPHEKDNYAYSGIINNLTGESIMTRIYKDRIDTIDMIGKRAGKLEVISLYKDINQRGAHWLCRCDCGNETIAGGRSLRMVGPKARKSCGCLAESRIDSTGVNRLYSTYKRRAKIRNREFSLSREDFEKLIKGNCVYCGSEPKQILKRLKSRKLQILYNGVDRVNPEIGYILENSVSCCRHCNQSKSDLSVDQFKTHIERVYKWLQIGS